MRQVNPTLKIPLFAYFVSRLMDVFVLGSPFGILNAIPSFVIDGHRH